MKRTKLAALFSVFLAPAAWSADVTPGVDFYAGAYGWDAQPSGSFSSNVNGAPQDSIDVEDDLDFSENQNDIFYIGIDHAVPILPNIRLRAADISDSSVSTLSRQITYEGNSYNINDQVESRYQLDYQEATLYYTPLDTGTRVDIGLTARTFDAEFEIQQTDGSQRGFVAAEGTLPLVHLGLRADLPLTGLYVQGEVDAVSYDGNSMSDLRAAVGWHGNFPLGLELGYQRFALELDDVDDLDADLDLSGPYLALSLAL